MPAAADLGEQLARHGHVVAGCGRTAHQYRRRRQLCLYDQAMIVPGSRPGPR
jgi:hypothetical protein